MKTKSLILSILCLLAMWQMKGQVPYSPISPNALLDTVFDRFGNKYNLKDILIDTTKINTGDAQHRTYQVCSSTNYFDLYYETGCGMEGNSSVEIARRAVICQVLTDISNFIPSPLSNTGQKVKLWVRNINSMTNGNPGGILGLATSFYNVPANNTAGFGGIADNEIWKTIHTGVDSYTGVSSPLASPNGANSNSSSGVYFHGMMAFNFTTSINWNTTLATSTISPSDIDLYTIALHEITHALGFASLIDYNGTSKFGSSYNYYSRYDLFLKKGTNNLITNSGACNSMYNYQFNPSVNPNVLYPGCSSNPPTYNGSTDVTTCSVAITYSGSTNVPVYTPTCFEPPSSLSHFEDICQVPGGFTSTCTATPANNNLYYVMSNANGSGNCYLKRYLKPEERLVLCDLGYSVTTTFGSSAANNTYTYSGGTCTGINVGGVNDGINSIGSYVYVAAASTATTITGILANDYNTSTFECLQDIYDPTAYLSVTSGNSSTAITYSSSVTGIHLLRYTPVSSTGKKGNITYIYVFVKNGNCTPTACSVINNGGFESATNCGSLYVGPNCPGAPVANVNCLEALSGTPDIFVRGCTSSCGGAGMTVPTTFCSPSADTWNNSTTTNNNFIGLGSLNNWLPTTTLNESFQLSLNTPLLPGNSYVLKFVARVSNNGNPTGSGYNLPGVLVFAGSNSLLAPISYFFNSLPANLTAISQVTVPNNNSWNVYNFSITNTSTTNINYISIINAGYLNGNPASTGNYIILDDVSVETTSQSVSLNLPSVVCSTATLTNLSSYLSPSTPGGVFSGPGVGVSAGVYSFTASVAGIGTHNIVYTYTNNVGCPISVGAQITVTSPSASITASASPTVICSGQQSLLSASGAASYTWQPGNITGSAFNVFPTSTTIYTVIGTVCTGTTQSTITVSVNASPSLTVSPIQYTICSGQSATLSASGATSYTWSTGANTSSIVVYPSNTTIYSVIGGISTGCTSSKQATITVKASPYITISPSSTLVCSGYSVNLTGSGASTYSWQPGGSASNPLILNPTSTTVYTLTGTSYNGCSSVTQATVNVPQIIITPSYTNLCGTGSATLTASGGTSYTWSPGGVTNPLVVTPTVTTTYTVQGNASGCLATSIATVSISSLPTVSITNTTTTICNSSVSFTAVPTPTNVTYSWKVWDASMTSTLSVPITGSATATPTINFNNVYQNVNICATVTNTAGCSATTCTLLTTCCQTPTNTTKYTNTTFTTNTSLVGSSTQKYQFSGTITVSSGTLQLVTADVTMDPFTKIIVNNGAKLQISESYLHGCNAMWRGIVAVGASSVNITGSKVDDGIRALVDSTGAATFYVRGNYFNNNYISILGKGSKPTTSSYTINQNIFTASTVSPPTGTPYVPTTPTYTVAPYLYSYPVSNLLYPYQNQKAYVGIELLGAGQTGATNGMIPIGTSAGYENIFDKLQMGIHAYLSNVLVQNNVFQNINSSVNPGTKMGGVYCEGYSGLIACHPPFIPCPTTNTVVVSSGTTTANTFKDNDYGVYSTGKLALSVISNTFTNQSTGVYVTNNNASLAGLGGNDVTINRNKINTSVIGVELYNNSNGKYNVIENRIDNTTTNTNANYQNNFAIRFTEASLSTNPSNFPYYNVYNNYVYKYYNGINTALTYSAQISDNDITLLADNTNGHVQVGINFSNTNSCYVLNNQVTISGSSSINNSWQIGLATANSTVEKIRCNQIKNICFGLYFVGQNYTAPGDGIIANQMDNNAAGIMLLSGGEIGNQYYTVGGTNYSADNQWLNWQAGAYRTYVNDGNLTSASGVTGQSYMYTRSTPSQYDIPFGSYFPSTGSLTVKPLLAQYTSNTTISCTYSATPLFKTNSAQLLNGKLMQMGREIGANAISYQYNSDNFKEVSRRNLLRNIKLQQLDVSQDSILNPFVQNVVNENTGRFFVIDSLLNEKDSLSIIQAQQLNQAIVSVNDADALLQQSNALYIKSLNGQLKPSELAALEQIARECPSEKGQAVIQARAVAFQYTHKTYKNNCETVKFKGVNNHRMNQAGSGQNQVYLYPNPTNNLVYIFSENDQPFMVRFYNMIGELVLEKEKTNHEAIDISGLPTGMYIYKIYSNQELMVNGKLIISK